MPEHSDEERGEGCLIEPGRSYPVWSPDTAYSAAAVLLQTLEEEKGQHGQPSPQS